MHCKQNYSWEQGTFKASRPVYQKAPEQPSVQVEKQPEPEAQQPSEKVTTVERFGTKARLANLSLEIGVETPMKEMLAIERGLSREGQKAEYAFRDEKLTATKEKDGVVWRNAKGEVVQKAEWLRGKTDKKLEEQKKNLGGYWNEVAKKYSQDEKVREASEKQTHTDLQKAQAENIYNLQGGWDKAKMSRMFLGEQRGSGLTFKVDLKGNDKFENYVGAGDILPPSVTRITVIDLQGQQRTGTRQIQNGRVGYFDAQGYIPIFSGYTIGVLDTVPEGGDEAKAEAKKEQQAHTEMNGTIWRKDEAAPTELGNDISPTSGYRYTTVNGKRVEVKPPKPNEKVYEAKEPEQLQQVEHPEAKESIYQFGKERVYINVPKFEQYKDKKPRVVVYFHGNGGSIESSLKMIQGQVQKMREAGDPVILVVPENRIGGWQDFRQPGSFSRLMALTDQVSGVADAKISIASHSGGYFAVQNILHSHDMYDRIASLGLLDSAYGNSNQEFIRFASDPSKKLHSTFTPHLADKNRQMVSALLPGVAPEKEGKDTVWRSDDDRIDIRTSSTYHGNVPNVYFESFVS